MVPEYPLPGPGGGEVLQALHGLGSRGEEEEEEEEVE